MRYLQERVRLRELLSNKDYIKLLEHKGCVVDFDNLFYKYETIKSLQTECDSLIHIQKNSTKEKAIIIKKDIKSLREKIDLLQQEISDIMEKIPNVPHISVPFGRNENDNVVIKTYGEIKHNIDHFNLKDICGYQNSCGSRFVYLQGNLPHLERALINFMLDFLKEKDFQEYSLPILLKKEAFYRSRHLPKDKDVMFFADNNSILIPTTEVSLLNLFQGKILRDTVKVCAVSDCFRKEAGAAGKDTKGLIRLHQFKKCEMVIVTHEDNSYSYLEHMLENSCEILRKLEIPHRILNLCTGDMPFTSAKTYDIEIPIGGKWREVASISNCTNFQTITMDTKFQDRTHAHALNGSALAIGRTMASLIEVHYEHGYINIPKPLQKYMNNQTKIQVA